MNIIAYGSLMNQRSLEKTLQRQSALYPITVKGFRRVFNAPFGDFSFLNLTRDPTSCIDALYFSANTNEIKHFAVREKGSELIEVIPHFFAFIWPSSYCKELPVLQSYISFCAQGANDYRIDFFKGLETPRLIYDDADNPLYVL